MGARFLGKRREKMLGLRLVLSRAIWKDKDHLGEGQREWKGGEISGDGGKGRDMEENGGKTRRPMGEWWGDTPGVEEQEKEVDGGGRAAPRAKYGHI